VAAGDVCTFRAIFPDRPATFGSGPFSGMQRGLTFHSAKSTTMHSRILSLIVLLTLAAFARAATYTVTNTSNAGAGSLRDAIGQANANPGADTIDFDTAGVFSTS